MFDEAYKTEGAGSYLSLLTPCLFTLMVLSHMLSNCMLPAALFRCGLLLHGASW